MPQAVTSINRDLDLKHVWHGNMQHRGLEARPPLEVAGAEGCYVFDADGRRYLDGMAGLVCVKLRDGRREILGAGAGAMAALGGCSLEESHRPAAPRGPRGAGCGPGGP